MLPVYLRLPGSNPDYPSAPRLQNARDAINQTKIDPFFANRLFSLEFIGLKRIIKITLKGFFMTFNHADIKKVRRTSAGALVLRQDNGKWHALLLRAWSHWDFPKGNVEQGETLLQAAVREVKEETGIENISFPWGEAFARTAIYSKDKVAYYSIAETEEKAVSLMPNPVTGETEHDEYRWVPWDELPTLLSPRLDCILEWASHVVGLPAPNFKARFQSLPSFSGAGEQKTCHPSPAPFQNALDCARPAANEHNSAIHAEAALGETGQNAADRPIAALSCERPSEERTHERTKAALFGRRKKHKGFKNR